MNNRVMKFILLITLIMGTAFSQGDKYPYLKVTPENPNVTDDVTVQVIVGEHPNGCVPKYKATYKITEEPILCIPERICPSIKTVAISYTSTPADPGICLPALTEHGPTINMGKLSAGTYNVNDNGTLVGSFTVTSQPVALSGVVSEDTGPMKILKLLAGVKVYIAEPMFIWGGSGISSRRIDSTVTDNMGRYSFKSVPSGNYQVQFVLAGYQTYFPTVTLAADTTINAALLPQKAMTSVSGKAEHIICGIVSCDPHPLPGVEVTLSIGRLMGDIMMLVEYKDTTDAQGNYSLRNIPFDYNTKSGSMVAKKIEYQDDRKTASLSHILSQNVNFLLTRLAPVSETKTVGGVEFKLSSPGSEFSYGQEISVTYTARNTNSTPVGYDFNTAPGCHYELKILNDKGVQVYSYVSTLRCLQVQNTLTIAPGETASSSFPARALNPGNYTFTGSLNGKAFSEVSLQIAVNSLPVLGQSFIKESLSLTFEEGLRLHVSRPQRLSVQGFDLRGKAVSELHWDNLYSVGTHSLNTHSQLSPGQYLFVIQSNAGLQKQKIVVP